MHVVDEVGGEELANCRRSSADSDIQSTRRLLGCLQGLGWAGVDEVERRPALQPNRGSRVVGENEHGGMEGRVVAPPAFPLFVGPWASLGAELIAAHDLCADARAPVAGERVVDACASAWFPLHLPEGAGGEEPFVQPGTGVAEGRLATLALAGPEAVERNREVVDANA